MGESERGPHVLLDAASPQLKFAEAFFPALFLVPFIFIIFFFYFFLLSDIPISDFFLNNIAWSRHGKACILLTVGAWVELSFTMGFGQSDIPPKERGGRARKTRDE